MFPSYGASMYTYTGFLLAPWSSSRISLDSTETDPSSPSSTTTVEEIFKTQIKVDRLSSPSLTRVSRVEDRRYSDSTYEETVSKEKVAFLKASNQETEHEVNQKTKHKEHTFSAVTAVAEAALDLIHLKSPTSTSSNVKLGGSDAVPVQRRRSADVAENPQYYTENERVNHHETNNSSNYTIERVNSTVLTPTATSFSKDELNEIFNISRHSMDIEKSPLTSPTIILDTTNNSMLHHNQTAASPMATTITTTPPTTTSMAASPSNKPHNIALDESNFSMDSSSIMESSCVSQTESELNSSSSSSSRCSDDNNNMKNGATVTPIKSDRPIVHVESSSINNKPTDTPSPANSSNKVVSLSKLQMVCREIFMTEKSYVNDLQDIIEGYIYHLKQKGDLDVESIFGNLEDIYEFNKEVLYQIEQCEMENYEIDPILLATVFYDKARGFNSHYTQYCTNYPEASQFFSIIMEDPGIHEFFLERQKVIGHALPLQSYLLKPVQRIMKYHLLFRDILKRYEGNEEGYNAINNAVLAMTDVAEYINEMKRLHENAVKVQEIISNIAYLDAPIDVYATGRLVLENSFKVHGVRGDRVMYLFEKLLLICKKSENNFLQFKEKIECCNMMLVESIAKDALGFQIMRFDNRKVNYTIIAKTIDIKKEWVKQLKRLILENHAAVIPQTARQAILGPEDKAKSKYNSLPIQALDDQINVRNIKKNAMNRMGKENGIPTAGVKRESNEKESSFLPKRPLNSKAKEYLTDKKTRTSMSASNLSLASSPLQQQQPVEKEKKEILRWIRRHKHKPSLDSGIILDSPTDSQGDVYITPVDGLVKSRSLESLKEAIVKQDQYNEEMNNGSNILKDIINYNFEQKLDDAIEQTIASGKRSRPISMVKSESSITDGDTSPDVPKTIEHLERPDSGIQELKEFPEQQFTSGIKIKKSMSVVMRKKVVGSTDDLSVGGSKSHEDYRKRWSAIPNDVDRIERLEKRLSLISDDGLDDDDGTSITSIKNMVRKVSNAFNSSFQTYDDSQSMVENDSSVTRDLGKIIGNAEARASFRKSTGGILDSKESLEDYNRSKGECITYESVAEDVKNEDLKSEDSASMKSAECDVDSNGNQWCADVDQVFNEVNADISSIANSIESTGALKTDVQAPTSVGLDITNRAALVDMRLKEANDTDTLMSPTSAKKVNVEVKRVADRIKEYKRLIDSERRRNSWRRREPKTMNEMMENLDTINSTDNGLTPTYTHYRRRFRNSRDFDGNSASSSVEMSPRSSCSSIKRSFSENYAAALENERSQPMSASSTPIAYNAPNTDQTLKDSIKTLNNTKDRSLNNNEDISTRTRRYHKALQNIENKPAKADSLPVSAATTSLPTSSMESTVVRRLPSTSVTQTFYNPDADEYIDNRNSGEWSLKSQTLPHPRRTNAIKRAQSGNFELDDEKDFVFQRLKSRSIEDLDLKNNDDSSTDVGGDSTTSSDDTTNKNTPLTVKKTHRSTSLPRLKKHTVNSTIHEEVGDKQPPVSHKRNASVDSDAQINKYTSMSRGRSRRHGPTSESSNQTPGYLRSVSLPRRAPHLPKSSSSLEDDANVTESSDEKTSSLTIVRSPSIRCIQSNHVNNRIKEYFTNLQKSSEISRSRPNLVFAASNSLSDSDPETSSNDDRASPDENKHTVTDNSETILKGTVRSMIKRYGKQNYVFDDYV